MTQNADSQSRAQAPRQSGNPFFVILFMTYLTIGVGVVALADAGLWPFASAYALLIAGIFLLGALGGLVAFPIGNLVRRFAPWMLVPTEHAPDILDKAYRYLTVAIWVLFLLPGLIIIFFNPDLGFSLTKGPANSIRLGLLGAILTFLTFYTGRGIWRRWRFRHGATK
jgi:hypothetical protein